MLALYGGRVRYLLPVVRLDCVFAGVLKVLCKLSSHDVVICETTCFLGAGCSFRAGVLMLVGWHVGRVVAWVGLCLMMEEERWWTICGLPGFQGFQGSTCLKVKSGRHVLSN
jgi:hypothetical protein